MFVTTVTKNRWPVFVHDPFAREAIDILYRVQELHPFLLYGFVIMPDHCHFLLKISPPQTIAFIMNRFKMGVSHSIGAGPLWQQRFHLQIPQNPFAALAYIHANPMRLGLCDAFHDYPWSSGSGKWDVSPLDWQEYPSTKPAGIFL